MEKNTGALLPLEGGLLRAHEAVTEGTAVHELEHKTAAGAIEGDGEEASDVRMAGTTQELNLGLDLLVILTDDERVVRETKKSDGSLINLTSTLLNYSPSHPRPR